MKTNKIYHCFVFAAILTTTGSAFPKMVKEFENMETLPEFNNLDTKDIYDGLKKLKEPTG